MADRLFFALPGSIETRTGGTIYDKRLIAGLRARGWTIDLAEWSGRFPFPSAGDLARVEADLTALPDGALALIDGLAFGVLGPQVARQRDRLRLVALVHHPLALESGLNADIQAELAAAEIRALESAEAVIVTSRTTAEGLVRDYGVPAARITVAHPGTEARPIPATRAAGAAPVLLAAGTLSPRKGFDVLVAALSGIADLPWTCRIAGSPERMPQAASDLVRQIAACGLGDRIQLVGEVADLAPLYATSDLFVLPSRHEGYGMVFAEALRHGLPVIGCRVGAVPEVVPPEAGILVEVDDVAALTEALRSLIADPARRAVLAEGARRAGAALPSWDDTARLVDAALRALPGR